METKRDIIAQLAEEKVVERMVENITQRPLYPELKDLVQMVYLILLDYDESKLQDLWCRKEIRFFIARIIINQYRSQTSPYHTIYRKYWANSCDLWGKDLVDESTDEE